MPAPSLEWRFVSFLIWRDKLSTSNILRWFGRTALLSVRGLRTTIQTNKSYLAGIPVSVIAEWHETFAATSARSSLRIFDAALARIVWHQSQNHHVFLISGTLAPLAKTLAAQMPGPVFVAASELTTKPVRHSSEAVWTGELSGKHMAGAAKLRAIQRLAAQQDLDLTRSYAYGNDASDGSMLGEVGNPHAVNPSRTLACTARRCGWPIERWHDSRLVGLGAPPLYGIHLATSAAFPIAEGCQ